MANFPGRLRTRAAMTELEESLMMAPTPMLRETDELTHLRLVCSSLYPVVTIAHRCVPAVDYYHNRFCWRSGDGVERTYSRRETTMEELESAKRRCKVVIERIESFQNTSNKITPSSLQTLFKLAFSELAFLSRSSSLLTPLSVNIGHIEAVIHVLQQPFINGVSRVCKPIPFSLTSKFGNKSVHVDIVCTLDTNPVWIIVSDRNPKHISWNESHENKGLKSRIERTLEAAWSSVAVRPCSIVLFFSKGLESEICEKFRDEFGAEDLGLEFSGFDFEFDEDLEGDWTIVRAKTYRDASVLEIKVSGAIGNTESNQELAKELSLGDNDAFEKRTGSSLFSLVSRMSFSSSKAKKGKNDSSENTVGEASFVNFDTTALIALVSGISNGGTEKILAGQEDKLRQRFKGNYEFVIGQVMSEIENPIHAELTSVLAGKGGIICRSVCSEFQKLVSMCGGPNEKSRAEHLLRYLKVVSDSPSERMMSLPTTRNLALKNKIVFGTGDHWHAPTITANMAFVRAISQTGMSLLTIGHRPRALTGD